MNIKEKEMKIPQTYEAAAMAAHTIDFAPQDHKSALRGLMQRFVRSEIPLLRLSFRRMPNSEHLYSPKMEPS
jgi:hypothetical protein